MLVGIDEVGRGPWAGPLVSAAVILNSDIDGLADSKALSALKRRELARVICQRAVTVGIGWVSPRELDGLGLTEGVRLSMRRAVGQLSTVFDEVIIDGSYNYLPDLPARCLVKADASVPVVSAASIIAKVARDSYMQHVALRFPDYGFESHVGYGTKVHRQAIEQFGLTPLHRRSFAPVTARRLFDTDGAPALS